MLNQVVSKALTRPAAWHTVRNCDFRGRGHSVLDWIAGLLIVGFGAVSVLTARHLRVITVAWFGTPHLIGVFLIGNVIGLALVLWGWWWWRGRKRAWPVPKINPPAANSAA